MQWQKLFHDSFRDFTFFLFFFINTFPSHHHTKKKKKQHKHAGGGGEKIYKSIENIVGHGNKCLQQVPSSCFFLCYNASLPTPRILSSGLLDRALEIYYNEKNS